MQVLRYLLTSGPKDLQTPTEFHFSAKLTIFLTVMLGYTDMNLLRGATGLVIGPSQVGQSRDTGISPSILPYNLFV